MGTNGTHFHLTTNQKQFTQIWVLTHHLYEIAVVVPQVSFHEETSGGVLIIERFRVTFMANSKHEFVHVPHDQVFP